MSESIKIGGFGVKPNQLATLPSGENVYSISTPGKIQYVIGEQQDNSINVFSIATLNVLKPSQLYIPSDKVDVVCKLQVLAEFVFKSYVVERRYASRLWKMLDDHASR